MPLYHRSFTPGHLQFITSSTYRRAPLFQNRLLCRSFITVLADLRRKMGFALMGWVLMPDHFRLLLLPPSVHDESTYRVWQRRFFPFNVYTERKRLEKLNYMHHNPAKPRVILSEAKNPCISRNERTKLPRSFAALRMTFYFRGDESLLAMDRLA